MYWLSTCRVRTWRWCSSQHMRPVSLLDLKPFQQLGQTNHFRFFRFINCPNRRADQPTHPSRLICFFQHCRPGGTASQLHIQDPGRDQVAVSNLRHDALRTPKRPCRWSPPSRKHLAVQWSQTTHIACPQTGQSDLGPSPSRQLQTQNLAMSWPQQMPLPVAASGLALRLSPEREASKTLTARLPA